MTRTGLESPAKEGDSPVAEEIRRGPGVTQINVGHVEPGVKQGGPPPKAKYSLATDSAVVARAINEKNPVEGSEIEPETLYLQAVGALWSLRMRSSRVTACLLENEPTSYAAPRQVKCLRHGAEGKPSAKSAVPVVRFRREGG